MRTLFVLLVCWLAVFALSAAPGYELTTTAPEAGMYPLGSTFTVTSLHAPSGTFRNYTARIDAYVIWINPPRAPEYYVTYVGETNVWFIWNRETVAQFNPVPATIRRSVRR